MERKGYGGFLLFWFSTSWTIQESDRAAFGKAAKKTAFVILLLQEQDLPISINLDLHESLFT